MIAYNTTFVMNPQTEGAFLDYMRQEYIPLLMQSGHNLYNFSLKRIHSAEEGSEAISFAFSFDTDDEESLMSFVSSVGETASASLARNFGENVLGFSTLMSHIPL